MKTKLIISILLLTLLWPTHSTYAVENGSWCLRPVAAGEKRAPDIRSALSRLLKDIMAFCVYYEKGSDILAVDMQFLDAMRRYVEMARHITNMAKDTKEEYPNKIAISLIESVEKIYHRLSATLVFAEWAKDSYELWSRSWNASDSVLKLLSEIAGESAGRNLASVEQGRYKQMIEFFFVEVEGQIAVIFHEFESIGCRDVVNTTSLNEVKDLWKHTRS